MRLRFASLVAALAIATASLFAAPLPTVSYTVNIVDAGVSNPASATRSGVFDAATQVTCNLDKVAATVENPTFVRFDDPADASKDCRISVTSLFATLPYANGYRFAIRANGSSVQSPWSEFSPAFNYVAPYVATPGNVRPE